MYRALVVLSALLLLPITLATAASQYHLDVTRQASQCFVTCHLAVIGSVNLPGKDANSETWIAKNCAFDEWLSLMPLCLVQECASPPDVAYAVEYGTSFCHRAGVDNVKLALPETYLNGVNGSYFSSSEYLASGAEGPSRARIAGMATTASLLGVVFSLVHAVSD